MKVTHVDKEDPDAFYDHFATGSMRQPMSEFRPLWPAELPWIDVAKFQRALKAKSEFMRALDARVAQRIALRRPENA